MVVYVSSQVALSIETFTTNVTNETLHWNTVFIGEVFSFVSYKIAGVRYGLSTNITGEWLFSSVGSEMLFEILVG